MSCTLVTVPRLCWLLLSSLIASPCVARLSIEGYPAEQSVSWDGGFSGNDVVVDFCIASDSLFGSVNYQVRSDSRQTSNRFELRQAGVALPYTLSFRQSDPYFELAEGVWHRDSNYWVAASGCANVSLQVSFASDDLEFATAGSYVGRLVFKVKPAVGGPRHDKAEMRFTLEIPELVQVSGLEDMVLTGGGPTLSASDDFCVYVTRGSQFAITASSLEGGFELLDGAASLPYQVYVDDSPAGGSSAASLAYEQRSPGWQGDYSRGCANSGGENMRLRVETTPIAPKAGVYRGTLLLTVRPD
ncbi:hypothetical protein EDC56_2350 [Sinobacterium caligoides]|uniref:Fimbrial protein n=1 Tax=Sinobacterium caligoides TaxID=933926 RepID=A0A3N2DPZ4_9GAMM|nr:hypothetical protein [Sinobacterium caligoides]ROS01901.1 hypothetical protein EDC56_2350 [Sinobacterium caligoides]